jgi:hypothetical protein
MRLTGYSGAGARSAGGASERARTTVSGYVNENRQEVLARTGFPSATFPGQTIYKLRCEYCRGEYGSNGCDNHKRRCPFCQQGAKGEVLRESAPSLFE